VRCTYDNFIAQNILQIFRRSAATKIPGRCGCEYFGMLWLKEFRDAVAANISPD
jgi:hypothetical protein